MRIAKLDLVLQVETVPNTNFGRQDPPAFRKTAKPRHPKQATPSNAEMLAQPGWAFFVGALMEVHGTPRKPAKMSMEKQKQIVHLVPS